MDAEGWQAGHPWIYGWPAIAKSSVDVEPSIDSLDPPLAPNGGEFLQSHRYQGGSGCPSDRLGVTVDLPRHGLDERLTRSLSSSRPVAGPVTATTSVRITPLVYQSTTSLGLGQVQMPRSKEVVATGAAAQGSKKWYNSFC